MFSFRFRDRERLKVQFAESKDERTEETPTNPDQLAPGLVALKVILFLMSLWSNINGGIVLSRRRPNPKSVSKDHGKK